MPGSTTPITDREKAAIFAYKFGILPELNAAFIAADDKPAAEVKGTKSLRVLCSRWANSEKFKRFADYVDRVIADRDADARKRGREEAEREFFGGEEERSNKRTDTDVKKAVDYYDPMNQRKQINRIIAESADDPKTQLDAIKAIQQTQRDDRQAAKEGRSVRVYLPLSCDICPLWQKAKARREKKVTI